jgi:hypothetical protein
VKVVVEIERCEDDVAVRRRRLAAAMDTLSSSNPAGLSTAWNRDDGVVVGSKVKDVAGRGRSGGRPGEGGWTAEGQVPKPESVRAAQSSWRLKA